MEAQYTPVGPGQSMRLVYQVMGRDGPISNPRGIRYMPADGGATGLPAPSPGGIPALPDASAFMGALQLANLGVAVVNLAVTTAVLVEVKKQTRILREVQAGMGEIRAGVRALLERAERIDVNVAEIHLREALRHALQSAVRGPEVDLVVLAELAGAALARFSEPLQGLSPGKHPELRLSEDVREMVEATLHLLWAARLAVIEAHNLACAGNALKVVRDDDFSQSLQRLAVYGASEVRYRRLRQRIDEAIPKGQRPRKSDAVSVLVPSLFSLVAISASQVFLARQIRDRVDAVWKEGTRSPLAPDAEALLHQIADDATVSVAAENGEHEVERVLLEYLTAWAAHTDAGLLWRLQHEVSLQGDAQYWEPLEDWLQPLSDGADVRGVSREFVAAAT